MTARGPRRVDHYRVLRSDGKPSFSASRYSVEGDAERVCSRPAVAASKTLPLIEAIKVMHEKGVRSLVVRGSKDSYSGMLLAEDILNYLGGGELYDIVLNRYQGDFNASIRIHVGELSRVDHPYVYAHSKIPEIVELFLTEGVDIAPVVSREGAVIGVVSVHDILKYLRGLRSGRTAGEAAMKFIPYTDYSSTLRETLKQMVSSGLRFVLVRNELGQYVGYVDYKAVLEYVSQGDALKNAPKGSLEEAFLVSVGKLLKGFTLFVDESDPLEVALAKLLETNSGFAVVGKPEDPAGVLTEYDVFLALISGE